MLSIRLDPATEARLATLAEKTGRTKSFYARQAILEYIEDLEDYYICEQRMKDRDPTKTVRLDALARELGLDLIDVGH